MWLNLGNPEVHLHKIDFTTSCDSFTGWGGVNVNSVVDTGLKCRGHNKIIGLCLFHYYTAFQIQRFVPKISLSLPNMGILFPLTLE